MKRVRASAAAKKEANLNTNKNIPNQYSICTSSKERSQTKADTSPLTSLVTPHSKIGIDDNYTCNKHQSVIQQKCQQEEGTIAKRILSSYSAPHRSNFEEQTIIVPWYVLFT